VVVKVLHLVLEQIAALLILAQAVAVDMKAQAAAHLMVALAVQVL
jgi:hypothetical protein